MKTALVTGANRGIGLGIVKALAQNQIHVFACSRTENVDYHELLRRQENGGIQTDMKITPLCFDITDEKAVKAAVSAAEQESGGIDILVNNAGMSHSSLFFMTRMRDLKEVFETNFFAPMYLTQLVTRYMARRRSGTVINIGSVSGMIHIKGGVSYGAGKAALIFATKTLALELGPYGIRVNAVSPGFIDTRMWRQRPEEVYKDILGKTPLRRQGSPDEVAQAVLFLADEKRSSYITGSNLVIDGGGVRQRGCHDK